MSGDETRKWAAEWAPCGWWRNATDADLAEAVRVEFKQRIDNIERHMPDEAWERLAFIWLWKGPIAFIQAVREVVE